MKNEIKPLDFYAIREGSYLEVPFLDDGLFAGFPSPAEDHNLEAIDLTSCLLYTSDAADDIALV